MDWFVSWSIEIRSVKEGLIRGFKQGRDGIGSKMVVLLSMDNEIIDFLFAIANRRYVQCQVTIAITRSLI
jgi:hypothetical protein